MISSLSFSTRFIANASSVQERLNVALQQSTTGNKAETYGGYAPQARALIDVNVEIAQREAYTGVINNALPRLGTMQNALNRMNALAGDLRQVTLTAIGTGPINLNAMRAEAHSALVEIATLLNAASGGRHLFAGSDASNPPIPAGQDIAGGAGGPTLFADIAARLGTLDGTPGNTLDDVWADLTALTADDTAGRTIFSAAMSSPSPGGTQDEAATTALVEDGNRLTIGLRTPAYKDPAVVAADPDSTGSWMRDLVRDLMVIATLPDAVNTNGERAELMTRVSASLDRTMTRLNADASALGASEAALEAIRDRHADMTKLLKTERSTIQDVDYTEVSARLALLRTQLESSWALLGSMKELSLARFL